MSGFEYGMTDIAKVYNNGEKPLDDLGDNKRVGSLYDQVEIRELKDKYHVGIKKGGLKHDVWFNNDGSISANVQVNGSDFNHSDLEKISGRRNIEIGNSINIEDEKLLDWSKKYLPEGKEFSQLKEVVSERISMMQEFLPSKSNALISKNGDAAYYVGARGNGRMPILEVQVSQTDIEAFQRQYPRAKRCENNMILKNNPKKPVFRVSNLDDISRYASQKGNALFGKDPYWSEIKILVDRSPAGLLQSNDVIVSTIHSSKAGVGYDPLKREVYVDAQKLTQTEFSQFRTTLLQEKLPTNKIVQKEGQIIISCVDSDGLKTADSVLENLSQIKNGAISNEINQIKRAVLEDPNNKKLFMEIDSKAQLAQAAKKVDLEKAPTPKSIPEGGLSGKLSQSSEIGKEVRALDAVSDASKALKAGEMTSTLGKAGHVVDGAADAEKAGNAATRFFKALGKFVK